MNSIRSSRLEDQKTLDIWRPQLKITIQITGNHTDSKNISFEYDVGNSVCSREALDNMFSATAEWYNTLNGINPEENHGKEEKS